MDGASTRLEDALASLLGPHWPAPVQLLSMTQVLVRDAHALHRPMRIWDVPLQTRAGCQPRKALVIVCGCGTSLHWQRPPPPPFPRDVRILDALHSMQIINNMNQSWNVLQTTATLLRMPHAPPSQGSTTQTQKCQSMTGMCSCWCNSGDHGRGQGVRHC